MDKHRFHGLALDSEYRDRYQLYHLADGKVADSRLINWRQVEWEKVVKVETFIRGNRYVVLCSDPRFEFFMVFRWFGQEFIDGQKRQVNIWTQGWSDGSMCFLMDIDFKAGMLIKNYREPLAKFEAHIHPRVKDRTWKEKAKKQKFGPFLNIK